MFLRRELENKKKPSTNYVTFYITITMKPQNNFFFIKTSQKKKLSENVMTNNSVVNIDNDSSIANSQQSKFTKNQSKSTTNFSEALIIIEDISDKNKIKNDINY